MREYAFGCFQEMISLQTSQIQVAQILRLGERLWQTSPALTVTSAPISRTRASSQISTSVATSQVPHLITQTSTTVQIRALNSQQRMERTSRMRTGSSTVSKCIRHHRRIFYYTNNQSMGELFKSTAWRHRVDKGWHEGESPQPSAKHMREGVYTYSANEDISFFKNDGHSFMKIYSFANPDWESIEKINV